jgi:hypothetical protein
MGAELMRDARFWTAVVLLLKTALFYTVPDFPPEIWGAVDALLAVVIGAMAGQSAAQVARLVAGSRGQAGIVRAARYIGDEQEIALLVGLALLAVGLALYDVRVALIVIGGLLLGLAVLGALRRESD